jgi:UDP-2,3-diacylglucosamine hydrolase
LATLFISDLHLDARRPQIVDLFVDFLARRARHAEALYILGDLFEAWIGDDDDSELSRQVAAAIHRLSDYDVPVYFIHGNRDFLLGQSYAERCSMQLFTETAVTNLYGRRTLIMHGDTLCTDDLDYQALRAKTHDPAWQQQILALPLEQRRVLAQQLRQDSRDALQLKSEQITDVNDAAVRREMREHGVLLLIHGHTHRPAVHDFELDQRPAQRIVLGDWYEQGSVLSVDDSGCRLENLAY